jgi:hypothetical protein
VLSGAARYWETLFMLEIGIFMKFGNKYEAVAKWYTEVAAIPRVGDTLNLSSVHSARIRDDIPTKATVVAVEFWPEGEEDEPYVGVKMTDITIFLYVKPESVSTKRS